jgi:transposase
MMRRSPCRRRLATRRASSNPGHLFPKKSLAQAYRKLTQYLLELQPEVLPKSPSGAAVRYALNQGQALARFLQDGELEIDNGATERANRDIGLGRGNWTFFGSDAGGKTAAVLRSFIASCKRCGVEPFAWFHDVLSRVPAHSISRLSELLPHNWKSTTCPVQA